MNNLSLFLGILFLFCFSNSFCQAFELDSSFGNNGTVHLDIFEIVDFGPSFYTHNATPINVQEDGKIVLSLPNRKVFRLIRIHPDGTIDKEFCDQAIANFEQPYSHGSSAAIHADGKLTIAGNIQDSLEVQHIALAQFLPSGALDNSFGNNGKIIINDIESSTITNDIAIQSDGKIIVAGRKRYGGPQTNIDTDFLLLRFNKNGTLDDSFGNKGLVYTSFGTKAESPQVIKLQEDEKIVVGGFVQQSRDNYDFVITRYHTNGSLDETFGTEGKVTLNFDTEHDEARHIIIQPNGKIVVCGFTTNRRLKTDLVLVRLNKNGSLDSSFGNEGKVITDLTTSDNIVREKSEYPTSLIYTPNGKLLVAGSTFSGFFSHTTSFLVQYTKDGVLDNDFNNNGIYIEESTDNVFLNSLALQSNGEIIHAGISYENEDWKNTDLYLVRYLPDLKVGTLDLSLEQHTTLVYPNPAKQLTKLSYTLQQAEIMSIQLIDINGQILKTYTDQELQQPGNYAHQISLPNTLETGVYFLRLSSPNGERIVKIVF